MIKMSQLGRLSKPPKMDPTPLFETPGSHLDGVLHGAPSARDRTDLTLLCNQVPSREYTLQHF